MNIFIDAGHNYNLYDTGATGNGLREQDITYAVASKIKSILDNYNCNVKLSRETKETNLGTNLSSSLMKRCELANNFKADIFISIHCNSASDKTANGTETFLYNQNSKCKDLASLINSGICAKLAMTNRGIKYRNNLAVLKYTNMPAMLIELGFISNYNDSQKLANKQQEFAEAIANEIIYYYDLKPKSYVVEKEKNNKEGIKQLSVYENKYEFYINNEKQNINSLLINNSNYVRFADMMKILNINYKVEDKKIYIEK